MAVESLDTQVAHKILIKNCAFCPRFFTSEIGSQKTLEISIKENTAQNNSNKETKYYVLVDAYSQKENAENQLQKAKSAGFTDAFIKEF